MLLIIFKYYKLIIKIIVKNTFKTIINQIQKIINYKIIK